MVIVTPVTIVATWIKWHGSTRVIYDQQTYTICQNDMFIYRRGNKFGRIATGGVRAWNEIACQEIAQERLGYTRYTQDESHLT